MRKTQKDIILDHIHEHGYITSLDAYEEYGITQLATRIKELKQMGFVFSKERRYITNRYGYQTHYDRYMIEE